MKCLLTETGFVMAVLVPHGCFMLDGIEGVAACALPNDFCTTSHKERFVSSLLVACRGLTNRLWQRKIENCKSRHFEEICAHTFVGEDPLHV